MRLRKTLAWMICILFVVSVFAQGTRGKAELKAGAGSITVDYGQPALKGRDMLSKLEVGQSWRMGSNQATVINTPVDLSFGSVKVAKGTYSLFLNRTAPEKYELVFNSQTGQWGMQHDASKDVYRVPLKKDSPSNPVEVFQIELKSAPKGGVFELSWGATKLSTDFQFAQ